jgi:hypothetical protein
MYTSHQLSATGDKCPTLGCTGRIFRVSDKAKGQTMELNEVVSSEGTYVKFVEGTPKPKTKTWNVIAKEGEVELGWVGWFSKWRKYCFFPAGETIYEEKCLRDIAQFIQEQTKHHRMK